MTVEQTLREFREIARRAKDENGGVDFIYQTPDPHPDDQLHGEGCLYVHYDEDGTPSAGCIVGGWLNEFHGVPLDQLAGHEGSSGRHLCQLMGAAESNGSPILVQYIQRRQDKGVPWLQAIEEAEDEYRFAFGDFETPSRKD